MVRRPNVDPIVPPTAANKRSLVHQTCDTPVFSPVTTPTFVEDWLGFNIKCPDTLHASMFTHQNFDALTLSVTLTLIMSYKYAS